MIATQRRLAGLLAGSLGLGVAAAAPVALAAKPAAVQTISPWLNANPAKRLAILRIVAGYRDVNGGENFDGYTQGKLVVTIPQGWTVKVLFHNAGNLNHSFVVEPFKENINSPHSKPAFPGAETPNPVTGVNPGASASVVFKAAKAGHYRIMCAVPGHAALGMWDVFNVKAGLARPTISPGPSTATPKVKAKATRVTVSPWLWEDPAAKTVHLRILAGYHSVNGGFNFDGYANGKMVVTVPLGWKVDVLFKNVGELNHSFVVEPFGEKITSSHPKPAFAGAEVPDPVVGVKPGGTATAAFAAAKAGHYRFLCGVPGHAAIGMWDVLNVKPGLKSALVVTK